MEYFSDLEFTAADMLENTNLHLNLKIKFFGLQYIHAGSMNIRINQQDFHIVAPVLFFTYPGATIEYNPDAANYRRTHYWICFQGDRVEKFLSGGLMKINSAAPFFPISAPDVFQHIIHELMVLIKTGHHNKAVLQLENILLNIIEEEYNESKLPLFYASHIKQLLIEIMKNPQSDWDFRNESLKLHITLNHFNRLFREIANTSPRQYVIKSQLHMAATLLKNSLMPIKEVSLAVGIENEFYFSRLFKKKFFMSPVAYRSNFFHNGEE